MSIAITDDHRALASTVSSFLAKNESRAAARALLEAPDEPNASFYAAAADLGWLGLHVPEELGGSGFGLEEVVVVVEQLGRALAPGAFVPTLIASAVLVAAGTDDLRTRLLPGLADGSTTGAVALGGEVELRDGALHGAAGAVLGAGLADVLLVPVGDDVVVVDRAADGVTVETPLNLDFTRRTGRVTFSGAVVDVLPGARRLLLDLARTILSAEAVGVARESTELAAEYAKARQQFGRPIAMFQAVKHHCANMAVATELATAAVWDAARAAAGGGEQFSYAAAIAASLAVPAADECANLGMQVHGGIGFTWEHDCHLFLRRATAIGAVLDADAAAADATDLTRAGVRREKSVDLPPEAEEIRGPVRAFAAEATTLEGTAQRDLMINERYAMPHWPPPYGRGAGAIEQLVIEQEFAAAGIQRPQYGITGWVILTLIQHATEEQVSRWVRPALTQEVIWCQLFSEPDAGSDAAGITTRGTRVDGGWLVNGQKVWTSGAHVAGYGLATIRTNPDAPKHNGITMMVIDMHAQGVEVRPLKMATGGSEFNEVFFNDVLVPDDDVIGPVDSGWTVARATLGNESVSIGGGSGGGIGASDEAIVRLLDAHPERLPGGAERIGRYLAVNHAMSMLNLRTAHRAVAGGAPGPEGNITKLVLSENGHEATAIVSKLTGPDTAFMDGSGALAGGLVLWHRARSIAGGTSEIKRNQIGERTLGLPRDPLIR
ncbi:MAG: putative acyl-CoA dehydrogenase [Ilumatobacteraceae bacterium]|nr:putative acyl-CoA dehydrogenase [Ilumatobacteraceae bacterium]